MTATTAKTRLAAAERRAALVDAALRVFASGSYSGATTAEIAREAGVSEPILYRHFASKRDLYIACLEETWSRLRAAVEEIVANEPDPSEWPLAFARAKHALQGKRHVPAHIWIQALSVAGNDPEVRRYLRRHIREAHAYVAELLTRAQDAGGVPLDRDPSAEAWIGLGIGLLRSVQDRLGGILGEDDFTAITDSRRRWLTGLSQVQGLS
jgi:AcrR family transcriptional regulator